MILQIELEENNNFPIGYDPSLYESKGFYPTTVIQDLRVRGKAVYLAIKRRRQRFKESKNIVIHNDYSFVTEGSK